MSRFGALTVDDRGGWAGFTASRDRPVLPARPLRQGCLRQRRQARQPPPRPIWGTPPRPESLTESKFTDLKDELTRAAPATDILTKEATHRGTVAVESLIAIDPRQLLPHHRKPFSGDRAFADRSSAASRAVPSLPTMAANRALARGFDQATDVSCTLSYRASGNELVPQDPNDEPASVLLTRIRVEQHPHRPMKKNSKARRGAIRAREARLGGHDQGIVPNWKQGDIIA